MIDGALTEKLITLEKIVGVASSEVTVIVSNFSRKRTPEDSPEAEQRIQATSICRHGAYRTCPMSWESGGRRRLVLQGRTRRGVWVYIDCPVVGNTNLQQVRMVSPALGCT